MATKQDWLRSICEQPDDDHLRLVFADWLEENDDPDWATLIRWSMETECQYYRSPKGYTWQRIHDGPGRPPASEWVEAGSLGCYRFLDPDACWKAVTQIGRGFHQGGLKIIKGFITGIELPAQAFMDEGKLFFTHPIEEVLLTDKKPGWTTLWDEGDVTEAPTNANIPTPLFNLAWRRDEGHKYGEHDRFIEYTSNPALRQVLNSVCVEYGRQQAGLPPLRSADRCPTDGTPHPAGDSHASWRSTGAQVRPPSP